MMSCGLVVPALHGDEQVAGLIYRVLHSKPKGATHWSVRLVAEETGISKSTVGRFFKLFRSNRTAPRASNSPLTRSSWKRVRDIVGLYLNPPDHALGPVRGRKKPDSGARTHPTDPAFGSGLRRGGGGHSRLLPPRHHYALCRSSTSLDGSVITQCKPRHRHQEFLAFLQHLDRNILADLDVHLVMDNYAAHKHPKIKAWLARHPRYHLHFTPTYASWLNQVERWFALITQRAIRRVSSATCAN